MRAVVLGDGALRVVEDRPEPRAHAREAIVRVTLAGICGTDLELLRGYKGFAGIPGHEFVGIAESCPSRPELEGRRVVGEINASCGECTTCHAGRRSHCERRTALGIAGRDGVFAERFALPARNLHAVPDAVPDEAAVFTEPLAAACRVLEQVRTGADVRAVVIGDGRLGLLCAYVLRDAGCEVLLVGRHARKLGLAAARGIDVATSDQPVAPRADVVVEASGSDTGLEAALSLVRPCGTLVLKSTRAGRSAAPVDLTRIVVDEITVVGSRCGPFPLALHLLATGRVDVRPLVDARYPLSRAAQAFEHAAQPGVLKVLLEIG